MATGTGPQRQIGSKYTAGRASIEPSRVPTFKDTESLLGYLYADLTRMQEVASADVIIHPANRSLAPSIEPVRGIEAVQAHEEGLIAATMGTLEMEVDSITANSHFDAVLGTLHAGRGQHQGEAIAMPFCGVFRFVDGQAVEHWENAADSARLGDWLMKTASL